MTAVPAEEHRSPSCVTQVEAFLDVSLTKRDPNRIVFGISNEYMLPLVARLGYKWDDLTPVAMMAMDDFVLWRPEEGQ